jgi:hypothetical protein
VNHTSNASSTVTNSVIADAFSPADLLTAYVSLLVGVLIFLSIEIRIEIPKEEGVGIKSITRKLLYIITRYRLIELILTALVVAILIVPIILLFLQPQNPFLSILIFIAGLIMVSVRVIIHIVARRIGIILDIHDLRGKDRNG